MDRHLKIVCGVRQALFALTRANYIYAHTYLSPGQDRRQFFDFINDVMKQNSQLEVALGVAGVDVQKDCPTRGLFHELLEQNKGSDDAV